MNSELMHVWTKRTTYDDDCRHILQLYEVMLWALLCMRLSSRPIRVKLRYSFELNDFIEVSIDPLTELDLGTRLSRKSSLIEDQEV